MIGRTVSHYAIEDRLGEGGMGAVYLARDTLLGRKVAIKILHLELIRSNDALTRFARELSAIRRLHHRNVVRPLDHGLALLQQRTQIFLCRAANTPSGCWPPSRSSRPRLATPSRNFPPSLRRPWA